MKRNIILIIVVIVVAIIFSLINFYSGPNDDKNREKTFSDKTLNTYTTSDLDRLKHTENFLPGAVKHIFLGSINNNGEAEGFHYSNISNSPSKIISGTLSAPNKYGVFKAKVKIDGKIKSDDNSYSTFFPNSLSPQMVINSINQAYDNAKHIGGNIYIGKSNNGIEIEMYLTSNKKIISAFPKY